MIRWLRALLGLHEHEWETVEKIKVFDVDAKWPFATDYILRCKHCGDIKKVRT